MPQRIAVIGSGVSGLAAAWLLSQTAHVTLIESAARLGGHTNTVTVDTPDGPVAVDTGFIVYNERNYPNLTALFSHFGIDTAPSDMGFSVSTERGRMEYCGRRLNGLFGQRRNVVRLRHWQMVADILRFFRDSEAQAERIGPELTLGEFLVQFGYSEAFIEDHILPISAAIWSTPARSMLAFPAQSFIRFFANHGLLQVNRRPGWRTVAGGAGQYLQRLVDDGDFEVLTRCRPVSVTRGADVGIAFEGGGARRFDAVVFACPARAALALLAQPSPEEARLLSSFRTTPNRAVLHTDPSFMPRRPALWSAWNYARSGCGADAALSVTYWMNRLQPLATRQNLFVTLNPAQGFAEGSVRQSFDYAHPVFDAAALAAQRQMGRIQGLGGAWYCGAWLGYGFHEDGLQSGLAVAERLGTARRPWQVAEAGDRIAHVWSGWDEAALRVAAE